MRAMKFKKLTLSSPVERSGLMIQFSSGATVIHAPNGFGKSALLKSLYDTFGAIPHKIDEAWRGAHVISAVEFEIAAGGTFTMVKSAGAFGLFDHSGDLMLLTSSATELSDTLAEIFQFHLMMADANDVIVRPPPSYIFAPFYIDQDKSWNSPWKAFRNLYLPRSPQILSEYHSGLKPNDYYIALAEKEKAAHLLAEAEQKRKGLADAIILLEQVEGEGLHLSLDNYQNEIARLVREATKLQEDQSKHKAELSELLGERGAWTAQIGIAQAALSEFEEMLTEAVGHPIDIECPTCGHHYNNDVRAQFNIAADADALMDALQQAQRHRNATDLKIALHKEDIEKIASQVARVDAILSVRRGDLSLKDVIAAEGRSTAIAQLNTQLDEIDKLIGRQTISVGDHKAAMRRSIDKRIVKAIKEDFSANIAAFGSELDVPQTTEMLKSITGSKHGRGSKGPRGLAAYYYAFLVTASKFGNSIFCPLVIDEPNQQGQDDFHLATIISFLVNKRPEGSQLILGIVDEPTGLAPSDASIVSVGVQKDKLLDPTNYAAASAYLMPFIQQMTAKEVQGK